MLRKALTNYLALCSSGLLGGEVPVGLGRQGQLGHCRAGLALRPALSSVLPTRSSHRPSSEKRLGLD